MFFLPHYALFWWRKLSLKPSFSRRKTVCCVRKKKLDFRLSHATASGPPWVLACVCVLYVQSIHGCCIYNCHAIVLTTFFYVSLTDIEHMYTYIKINMWNDFNKSSYLYHLHVFANKTFGNFSSTHKKVNKQTNKQTWKRFMANMSPWLLAEMHLKMWTAETEAAGGGVLVYGNLIRFET